MAPRLAAVVVAALVLAAPAAASPIDSSWDTVAGVSFHPFTTEENNLDCVPWVDPSGVTTRNCDPVNVVFPDQTIAQVQYRLQVAGWVAVEGAGQRLHFGDAMNWPNNDLQMAENQTDTDRYHVRLWQVGPDVIGAVHHDAGSPHHLDLPWETSEAHLAGELCSTWCQHVALPHQQAIQNGATWRGFANDGVATVIPLNPPPPPPATTTPAPTPAPVHHRKHKKKRSS
ncbi:MAG: hypothetical protein ABUS54_11755 [Actinomycetota bacterium]